MAKRETTIGKDIAIAEKLLKSKKTTDTQKEKLRSKISRLKKEAKGIPMTAKQLANATLRQRTKLKELALRDWNDLIRRLAKKPEYSFLKGMSRSAIDRDLARKAKPVGYRFKGRGDYRTPTASQIKKGKRDGSVYWEARANRSDVSSALRLDKGGEISSDQAYYMAEQIVSRLEDKDLLKGSARATRSTIEDALTHLGHFPYVAEYFEDSPVYARKGRRLGK